MNKAGKFLLTILASIVGLLALIAIVTKNFIVAVIFGIPALVLFVIIFRKKASPKRSKLDSITDPIDGYKLTYHYKDVIVSSWEYIPKDVRVGNRVICIQEPTNEYDDKAVLLMFVPQRKKFGYIYISDMQDMINDYLNRGDKVVARLSHLSFKPCKTVKIDIAFFKKDK